MGWNVYSGNQNVKIHSAFVGSGLLLLHAVWRFGVFALWRFKGATIPMPLFAFCPALFHTVSSFQPQVLKYVRAGGFVREALLQTIGSRLVRYR